MKRWAGLIRTGRELTRGLITNVNSGEKMVCDSPSNHERAHTLTAQLPQPPQDPTYVVPVPSVNWSALPPSHELQGGPADVEQGGALGLHDRQTPQRRERRGRAHRAVSWHARTSVTWLRAPAAP